MYKFADIRKLHSNAGTHVSKIQSRIVATTTVGVSERNGVWLSMRTIADGVDMSRVCVVTSGVAVRGASGRRRGVAVRWREKQNQSAGERPTA
jgi:hypothetical protein